MRPTRVIEHGVVDPGYRYTGEIPRSCAVVINEAAAARARNRNDLLARFESRSTVELFGMGAGSRGGYENLPQDRLHGELARRRVYLHPIRWTSLGLSLIEAMHLGCRSSRWQPRRSPKRFRKAPASFRPTFAPSSSRSQRCSMIPPAAGLGRNARA